MHSPAETMPRHCASRSVAEFSPTARSTSAGFIVDRRPSTMRLAQLVTAGNLPTGPADSIEGGGFGPSTRDAPPGPAGMIGTVVQPMFRNAFARLSGATAPSLGRRAGVQAGPAAGSAARSFASSSPASGYQQEIEGQRKNFKDGKLDVTSMGDRTVHRVSDLAGIGGRWVTPRPAPPTEAEFRDQLAVQPNWNSAQVETELRFPPSTVTAEGLAAGQLPKAPGDLHLSGGGEQIFVPRPAGAVVDAISHYKPVAREDPEYDFGLAYGGFYNSGRDLYRRDNPRETAPTEP